MPDTVNPQITDAVSTGDTRAPLGDAPAIAMGNLYQSAANAMSMALQNAVNSQQQAQTTQQAATIQGVNLLYSLDAASAAVKP